MTDGFNKVTKKVILNQSSSSINLNLDANTDIKDIKRLHKKLTYIDGSPGEKFVSLGKEIVISINELSSDEFVKLRNIWKSKNTFQLTTERNEVFLVRWIEQTYDMLEEESFDETTFHSGTITLVEV